MVKRYYKIVYGYEPDNYVPIEGDELEKAIYAHLTLARAAFRSGSVDFSRGGIMIQPDFNAAMGWTRGYKLAAEDFVEISRQGVDRGHTLFFERVEKRVKFLKESGKEELIGQNVPIPQLDASPPPRLGTGATSISDILKEANSYGKEK